MTEIVDFSKYVRQRSSDATNPSRLLAVFFLSKVRRDYETL